MRRGVRGLDPAQGCATSESGQIHTTGDPRHTDLGLMWKLV